MIIYGWNPVREAIRSHPDRLAFVALAREEGGKLSRIASDARREKVLVRFLTRDQIDRMCGGAVHNGVIAELTESGYADFDDLIELESTSFVLILDAIQDPQNFGAILRVADGFGIDVVVIPEHESCGLTPSAVKASAGASEWVSVCEVTNLSRSIEALKAKGYWVYGAAAGGDPITDVDFTGKVALVVGNEGKGIRKNVLEHCDRTIAIPMRGHVESFNVAAATAVICYEIDRQRAPGREAELVGDFDE